MHTFMENTTKKLVVPIVTATSTFADLTLKLLYSFQETDRLEVEKLLANREKRFLDERDAIEKGLKSELHKVRRDRDMLVIERDSIEKSLKFELGKSRENYEMMMKREREVMEKKVALVLVEKLKVEDEFEKCRRVLEGKIEILERENQELRGGNGGGGVGNGVEVGVFSSDPSSMYSCGRSGDSVSHKRGNKYNP